MAESNINQAEQKDTYEKKLTKNQKIEIALGLTALATAITLLIRKKLKAKNILKNKKTEHHTPSKTEEPKTPKIQKEEVPPPKINYEKNGNPQSIIGINESEAKKLQKEFKEAEERIRNTKSRAEMNYEETQADMKWYKDVKCPLDEKIKKYNVSVIEKKTFSKNPTEQVEEKRKYIEDVISKMSYNEASYYDGLVEFEKYGKREKYKNTGTTTLVQLGFYVPKNPTEKTVNKLMDIFDQKAIFKMEDSADGLTCALDGQQFISIIAKKDVLKTEAQVERAVGICKKLVWIDENVNNLMWTLIRATDAPFKGNEKIKKLILSIHESAKEVRAKYKEHPVIQNHEAWLAEHPISY